ncbi:MAG: hypothetical protein RLN75_02710 [Longimicrobiales bacterium]
MPNFASTGPAVVVFFVVAVVATSVGGAAELLGFEGGLRIGAVAAAATLAVVMFRRKYPHR